MTQSSDSAHIFKEIQEAYEVLGSDSGRKEYDAQFAANQRSAPLDAVASTGDIPNLVTNSDSWEQFYDSHHSWFSGQTTITEHQRYTMRKVMKTEKNEFHGYFNRNAAPKAWVPPRSRRTTKLPPRSHTIRYFAAPFAVAGIWIAGMAAWSSS